MKLTAVPLLLSVSFCFVLSDDPDINRIIAKANQFFKDSGLTEADLSGFFVTPIEFKNGRISQLDTLELQEEKVTKKPQENGTRYDFNLEIALKKLVIRYRFEILLPFITPSGLLSVDVRKNSFHVEGHVFVGNDGNCKAVWNDGYVSKLEDYEAKIDPKDVRIPFLKNFYERKLNEIVHRELTAVVSLNIQGEALSESFKSKFNEIVCSGIKASA